MRALASHQCGPGSISRLGVICGLSLLLVLVLAPRVFLRALWFSFLYENQHSQVSIRLETVDERATLWKPLKFPFIHSIIDGTSIFRTGCKEHTGINRKEIKGLRKRGLRSKIIREPLLAYHCYGRQRTRPTVNIKAQEFVFFAYLNDRKERLLYFFIHIFLNSGTREAKIMNRTTSSIVEQTSWALITGRSHYRC